MSRTKLIAVPSLVLAFGSATLQTSARSPEPTDTEQARVVIDHILEHPDQGAISVHYINGDTRWERHFNADRLNSLAST